MPTRPFFQLSPPDRNRILTAAAETLVEKGLHLTTLADVAGRLHIEVPALAAYFEDMRDLIAAVVASAFQHFGALYTIAGQAGQDFWTRVDRLFAFGMARGYQHRALLHIYLSIAGLGSGALTQAAYDRFETRAAVFFQTLVLSGMKEKALRPNLDAAATAMHFQTSMRFLMSRRGYPLYRARSKAYFPDASFEEQDEPALRRRLIAHLRALYGAA